MTAPLAERALLVTLNISQWQARKRDKKVTKEVTRQHDAVGNAGNFNKMLLNRDTLAEITKVVSAARSAHAQMSLAWGDNGDRIVAGSLFPAYAKKMQELRFEFEDEVRKFVPAYPQFVQEARKELGSMYEPDDYPADVSSKFSFKVGVSPLATAADFRVDLSTEHIDDIKRELVREHDERQKKMLKECYEKVRVVVKRISENCAKEKPVIYDSLMGNARDLVSILPALNLTNDPELNAVNADLQALLVPTVRLKGDKHLRAATAQKADDLLARIGWA